MIDNTRDRRIGPLDNIRQAADQLQEAKDALYRAAWEIVGITDDDEHCILFDFLFNTKDETAEELLNILDNKLHPAHRREEDQGLTTEIKFPLEWGGLYDDEHAIDDVKSFVAKSQYETGTKARGEWIIDLVIDAGLFEEFNGGNPVFTIRRSSATLLETHTPGTAELFGSVDEAKARCQEIEDRLCSGEEELEAL